jgi:cell division protein FtsB
MSAAHWFQGMSIGLQQQLNNTVSEYEEELDDLSNDVTKLRRQVKALQAEVELTDRLNSEKHAWLIKKGHLNVGRARYRLQVLARDLVKEKIGSRPFLDDKEVKALSMEDKREINLKVLAHAEFYMAQEYGQRDMIEFPFHTANNLDIKQGRYYQEGDPDPVPITQPFFVIMKNYQTLTLPDRRGDASVEKAFVSRRLREWKKFGKYPAGNAFPIVPMEQKDSHGEPFLVLSKAEQEYLRVGKSHRHETFVYDDISHPMKDHCVKAGQSPLVAGVTFIPI